MPVYAMRGGLDNNRMAIVATAEALRKLLRPQGPPPHGGPGGHLEAKLPSRLTVEDLAQMVQEKWPGGFLLRDHQQYDAAMETAEVKRELLMRGEDIGRRRRKPKSTEVNDRSGGRKSEDGMISRQENLVVEDDSSDDGDEKGSTKKAAGDGSL